MSDNVIGFPSSSELPENPLKIAPARLMYCSHDSIVIDMHTRTIQCADIKCGAVLDPFSYLCNNAKTIGRGWEHYREMERRAGEISGRVNLMLREEQRLKSMLKRMQDKTGAVLTVKQTK